MDVVHDAAQSRFTATLDGHVAELVYERAGPGVLNLVHTGVPPELQGQGVGDALAAAAFTHAREQGYKVILTCPFLRRWIGSHPEQRDIVLWGKR